MVPPGGEFDIPKDAVCSICKSKENLTAFISLATENNPTDSIRYTCKKCLEDQNRIIKGI